MGCGGSKSVVVTSPPRKHSAPRRPSRPSSAFSFRKKTSVVSLRGDNNNNAQSPVVSPEPHVKSISPEVAQEVDSVPPLKTFSPTEQRPASAAKRTSLITETETKEKKPLDYEYIKSENFTNLSFEDLAELQPETVSDMWAIVRGTSDNKAISVTPLKNRKGWRAIRIFVSSTFKDFHQEREVLVKEIFPDLRLWCEQRKLRLVECDLRWGVPKDSTTEETIRICLSELDRCYEDNVAPFFLNLCGERAGWIPGFGDLTFNLASQYGWVYGLSVTEMEIVHGAFRKLNPNALFLMRNSSCVTELPDECRKDFVDASDLCMEKLKTLKSQITATFPEACVYNYEVESNVHNGKVEFKGLGGESEFSHKVFSFFKSRIEELYPLDPSPEDPLQVQREAHETFLDSRSQTVLGRDKMLEQIDNYVLNGASSMAPLLVVGIAGAGKSAVIAKSAHSATTLATEGKIRSSNSEDKKKWRVFFHFVGATPRSTDLASFLQRLTKELRPDTKEVLSDLDSLISLAYNLLENPSTEPTIVFVDAINQMDEDKQKFLNRWLPERLSPNVRVVISTIEKTESHQTIRGFKSCPTEIVCGPLDKESRQAIVENVLRTYNKRLDDEQMEYILAKQGSSNPLWLTLSCEELRVHGKFETVKEKIQGLPDDLISLEEEVFKRFEGEAGGELMRACVCMLEVSRHGLLETELLALLGDEKNIKVPEYKEGEEGLVLEEKHKAEAANLNEAADDNDDLVKQKLAKQVQETYIKDEKEKDKKEKGNKSKRRGKQINFLPAREWAIIYRNLKPLLRPCGDLGEGRLDFYHRSLSKAARRRYFSGADDLKKHRYNFWHGVLADYFEGVDDMDRKAEELPYHLEALLDNNRLIQCLMDWEVFHRLYSEDFSIDLLRSR